MWRGLILLLAGFLLIPPATVPAQTTGDIEGRIIDISGDGLPGVTVEAKSSSLQGIRAGVSGRDGVYRFPGVPPGLYSIKATLSGFDTAEETVRVGLDATATLDLNLRMSVREDVMVSGEVPLVDVTSTTTGTNYTNEIIERLPVARNYAEIVRSNPGVHSDRGETQGRSLALSIYGATSAENQWIIDGINTTSVIKGIQGKAINSEFIEEVEVKTGGYQAEYGRALGGIINVITKSGGNQFHGDAFVYYDDESTRAEQIVTSDDSLTGMRITPTRRVDFGIDLGGYIVKDRLWFFAAYDRIETPGTTSRYVSSPAVPDTLLFPRDQTDNLYAGKLTWNIANRTTLVATAFADPSEISGATMVGTQGAQGGLISSPDPGTWETRREIGGTDFAVRSSQLFGSLGVLAAQASRHKDRFDLIPAGAGAAVRFEDWTCEGGTPETPCDAPFEPNLVSGGLGIYGGPFQKNDSTRDQYRADMALYLGNHEVKFGGDYQSGKTTSIESVTGGQTVTKYSEFGQVYYDHFFIAKSPTDLTPVDNILKSRAIDVGFFLQDSWKVAYGVTVNAGLRWDQEDLRNYLDESVIKTTGEWQPRLGVIWDPSGKGKIKVYASAGRFYYALPTALSVFTYGSITLIDTYNFDPVDTAHDPRVIGHERPSPSVVVFAEPVDKGLKATYQDELTLGVERLFDPTFSVGLKGTYKRLGRIIEDRCDLDYTREENGFSSCAIVNLGSGGRYARGDFFSCNGLDYPHNNCTDDPEVYRPVFGAEPTPSARRYYRGIEILGRKSIREKLWLQASYVYSSLRGNIDGGVQQDSGDTAPGILFDFDYPLQWRNSSGRLFLDRPHTFRLDASFTTPFKLTAGIQGYVQSGAPLNKYGYFHFDSAGIHLTRRGYAGRLPTLWEANLMLGYPLTVGPVTVTAQAYVFNVFNNQIRTRQAVAYGIRRPPGYPDTLYDPEVPADRVNPNYGRIRERQDPRIVRGAIRIAF
jgi:hypothetical protein